MITCSQGHENPKSFTYCEVCSYPLDVSDREKISFIKEKIGGKISFEMLDNSLQVLDLKDARDYSVNLANIFPDLSNLSVRANKLNNSELLSSLKRLRYITIYLDLRSGKAKVTEELLDLLPTSIQSLTFTVIDESIEGSTVTFPGKLLSYFPNLKNLYLNLNPADIGFLSKGHDFLELIEILGEGFEFTGKIMNFPSLTSITAEYTITKLDLELRNLPNFDHLIVNLSDNQSPVHIKSHNVDYELELRYNVYY